MRQNTQWILWCAAAVIGATSALGQDNLDEIVVTAQKRLERLQDVPIQVDVFTEQAISDSGIKDTSDLVGHVPNMTFDRADTGIELRVNL